MERIQYGFKFLNALPNNIKEISLTEDGKKYDSRLYVTKVPALWDSTLTGTRFIESTVRGYHQDGTYVDFKVGDALNQSIQDEMYRIVDLVNYGEMTA